MRLPPGRSNLLSLIAAVALLVGALAVAVTRINSLQSEVTRLQLSIEENGLPQHLGDFQDSSATTGKPPKTPPHNEVQVPTNIVDTRLARRLKSGKGGKGSKSSKKGGSYERSCEGLRSLVFDLNTRIGDMGAETIRFNAVADELERTAMYASNGNTDDLPFRRKLLEVNNVDEDLDGLENGVQNLSRHRDSLKQGNERVSQLNTVLRESADLWFETTDTLSSQNGELSTEVDELRKENERLEAERDRLAVQVDNLRKQVDNFSDLVNDHASMNEQLNASTAELELQIERLQASNEEYQRINEELSEEIDRLDRENMDLKEENGKFSEMNDQLNATSIELGSLVQNLTGEVERLNEENTRLEDSVDFLAEQVSNIEQVNFELEDNVAALNRENQNLEGQMEELKQTNSELETILSFLEETSESIGNSAESMKEYLASQIASSRLIAAETLHNNYIQRVGLWDCAYRDYFGDEGFVLDSESEIPDDKFEAVIGYVNNRVLNELCLQPSDFQDYLRTEFQSPPIFTTNHVVEGINSYASKAFAYYFPDDREAVGISADEWALAGYDCKNLPGNRRFEFGKVATD